MKKFIFKSFCGLTFAFVLNFFIVIESALPWGDSATHKDFSRYAASHSVLDPSKEGYLNKLGFENGLLEILRWGGTEFPIVEWIARGAELEDSAETLEYINGTARSYNHFHNPLKPWREAGLNDWVILPFKTPPFQAKGQSSLLWAQDAPKQTTFREGDWSWERTRDNYFLALSSTTIVAKQEYFARTLRGLGHQMHLIQDASMPDHTRNDAHPEDSILKKNRFGSFYLETWAQNAFPKLENLEAFLKDNHINVENYVPGLSISTFDFSKLDTIYGEKNLAPTVVFVDTDQYKKENAPDFFQSGLSVSLRIGLSEYTNANFFSGDTIFAADRYSEDHKHYFPYPKKSSTDLQKYVDQGKLPEVIIAGDGVEDVGFWIKKERDGEVIEHFVRPSYYSSDIKTSEGTSRTFYRLFYRDEICHEDYAKKLFPRAIGYSSGLLNYFFRGELQVSALPIFYKNGIQYVRVKIKNMTPNETMENGYFVLTYQYRPTDGPPDGSKDKFGIAWYNTDTSFAPCTKLESGKDMTIDFIIDPTIPKENLNSVKLTLAYRGTLGNEKKNEDGSGGAVIGKVFTLGEIKFSEEWNNGPTGEHPWAHLDFGTSQAYPGHGTTSNVVEGDTLIKDNIRFAGYKNASANGSFIGVEYQYPGHEDGFPILITPKTSLQFKIDKMSINQLPPAPPGYTNHYQGLWLHFNNGLVLQLTQDGQAVYYGPKAAIWTFDLGLIFVDNIYRMFQDAKITIPEPLYLYKIDFYQQLFELQDPSTVEHHQHMEIDFISIVEEKEDEVKPQQ